MVELSSSTNSICKMALGIGTASLMSMSFTPDMVNHVFAETSYSYKYECSSEKQCFYQLNHESMQVAVHQDALEPIIDVPVVKKIRVKFNKPQKISFYAVENEDGFLI